MPTQAEVAISPARKQAHGKESTLQEKLARDIGVKRNIG
jgi:hypothetical protein